MPYPSHKGPGLSVAERRKRARRFIELIREMGAELDRRRLKGEPTKAMLVALGKAGSLPPVTSPARAKASPRAKGHTPKAASPGTGTVPVTKRAKRPHSPHSRTMKAHTWDLVDAVLAVADRCLLYGPPGTGKSYAATHTGLRKAQSLYVVTLTDETPAAELRGHYVPRDGNFIWQDGPAIAAWRNGGRLVVNEIQRASGDVLGLLLALTDEPDVAGMTLPTGEYVAPAKGFACVGTMNGDPEEHLDEALRSRFAVTIRLEATHPEALKALPKDLQGPAAAALKASTDRRVTIRAWTAFALLREALDSDKAAAAVFGDSAGDVLASLNIAKTKPKAD